MKSLFLTGVIFAALAVSVNAQMVTTPTGVADTLEIRNVNVKDHVINGEVVNKSSHMIRNVELLFQYHWLWKNEFKPGDDPPGRAFYIVLDREIRPGESVSFKFVPEPPLPSRSDGEFMTEVSLAGFSEVIPQATVSSR